MKNVRIVRLCIIIVALATCSCKKYLDQKPDKAIAVPSTLKEFELMMDYYDEVNNFYPSLSEIMCDNFYLTDPVWEALPTQADRDLYLWKANDLASDSWVRAYKQILTFNVILDNLSKVKENSDNRLEYNRIKGAALFLRAFYFQSLANLYAQPYNSNTASKDLGIVLRLNSDFNQRSVRSTVEETYGQILNDLKYAAELLPIKPLVKSRPSKPAAYGAIARTYLAMQSYDSAGVYANKCLSLYGDLMDYNELDAASFAPISRFNSEVIFQMRGPQEFPLLGNRAIIVSELYNSYDKDDLRKSVFFRPNGSGGYRFKGDYDGNGNASGYVFGGIVTDEMYLIRAESNARSGKIDVAMKDLNMLLKSRWRRSVTYVPYNTSNVNDAVQKILLERRKELLFRGARWIDLRRLRNESEYMITPKRVINGQNYELIPNSHRYTLQIPRQVITSTGITQNP